jgi:hypothetical protein
MTKSLQTILFFTFSFLLAASCATTDQATETPGNNRQSAPTNGYSSVIKDNAITSHGVVDVHYVDDKIYYEIPDSLLGRDFLMVSRVAGVPHNFFGFTSSGSKPLSRLSLLRRFGGKSISGSALITVWLLIHSPFHVLSVQITMNRYLQPLM